MNQTYMRPFFIRIRLAGRQAKVPWKFSSGHFCVSCYANYLRKMAYCMARSGVQYAKKWRPL